MDSHKEPQYSFRPIKEDPQRESGGGVPASAINPSMQVAGSTGTHGIQRMTMVRANSFSIMTSSKITAPLCESFSIPVSNQAQALQLLEKKRRGLEQYRVKAFQSTWKFHSQFIQTPIPTQHSNINQSMSSFRNGYWSKCSESTAPSITTTGWCHCSGTWIVLQI